MDERRGRMLDERGGRMLDERRGRMKRRNVRQKHVNQRRNLLVTGEQLKSGETRREI